MPFLITFIQQVFIRLLVFCPFSPKLVKKEEDKIIRFELFGQKYGEESVCVDSWS